MKTLVAGTWVRSAPFVNVVGTWRAVQNGYVNVSGTWRPFFQKGVGVNYNGYIVATSNVNKPSYGLGAGYVKPGLNTGIGSGGAGSDLSPVYALNGTEILMVYIFHNIKFGKTVLHRCLEVTFAGAYTYSGGPMSYAGLVGTYNSQQRKTVNGVQVTWVRFTFASDLPYSGEFFMEV